MIMTIGNGLIGGALLSCWLLLGSGLWLLLGSGTHGEVFLVPLPLVAGSS